MTILHFTDYPPKAPARAEFHVSESAKEASGSAECPVCGKDTPHGHHKQEVEVFVNNQIARWHLTAMLWTDGELQEKRADAWKHGYRSCADDYEYARRTGGDATTANPFLAKTP